MRKFIRSLNSSNSEGSSVVQTPRGKTASRVAFIYLFILPFSNGIRTRDTTRLDKVIGSRE